MRTRSVTLVLPVHNEELILSESVHKVLRFLSSGMPHEIDVVIAENGSNDGTLRLARNIAEVEKNIRVVHLEQNGRGRALKHVWRESSADILSYMDIDLSTDLSAFPALVNAVASEEYDIALGSRLLPGSVIRRCFKRELVSRVYNQLLKRALHTSFSDAQCGFKAISRGALAEVLSLGRGQRLVPRYRTSRHRGKARVPDSGTPGALDRAPRHSCEIAPGVFPRPALRPPPPPDPPPSLRRSLRREDQASVFQVYAGSWLGSLLFATACSQLTFKS